MMLSRSQGGRGHGRGRRGPLEVDRVGCWDHARCIFPPCSLPSPVRGTNRTKKALDARQWERAGHPMYLLLADSACAPTSAQPTSTPGKPCRCPLGSHSLGAHLTDPDLLTQGSLGASPSG